MILVMAAIFLVFSTACTRPETETTSVQLVIPKQMLSSKMESLSATSESLMHLVINVSGPNMPTIFRAWDSHDNKTTIPNIVTIEDVLSGSDRLFQVLAVYSSGGSS
jgi:hypothetical protein